MSDMHRWKSSFNEHPIHGMLNQIIAEIPDVDKADGTKARDAVEILRLRKVFNATKRIVSNLDPDLAPLDVLTSMHSHLVNYGILNHLKDYKLNNDYSRLVHCNDNIASFLNNLYQLASLKFSVSTKKDDFEASSQVFANFAKKVDVALDEISNRINHEISVASEGREVVDKIKSDISNEEAKLNSLITEWEAKAGAVVSSAEKSFSSTYHEFLASSHKAISDFDQASNDKMNALLASEKGAFEAARSKLEGDISSLIEVANKKIVAIKRLHGLAANASVTGGYVSIANREKWSTRFWRMMTILLVGSALTWLGLGIFYFPANQTMDHIFWLGVAKSASFTLILGSLAVYASKQAGAHFRAEKRMRQLALQLQAFDPFVEGLSENAKAALREELSKKIFGSIDDQTESSSQDFEFKSAVNLTGADLLSMLKLFKG